MKKTLLIVGVTLGLFLSCNKVSQIGFNCRDTGASAEVKCITFWTYFKFTIVDEKTGAELLFGNNQTLTAGDIKLFGKNNSPYTQQPFFTDTNNKQLYTMGVSGFDTMALQIKDEPLQYILVKNHCGFNQVCSRTAVEILHEGKLLIADENGLIRIKR